MAVRNSITGEILKGDVIPGIDEIEAWLEKNPNFELISRENASDSEDEKSEEEIEKPIPVVIEEKEDEYEGIISGAFIFFKGGKFLFFLGFFLAFIPFAFINVMYSNRLFFTKSNKIKF